MRSISVILADAQYLIRLGLKHILQNQENVQILGEAADEESLLNLLDSKTTDVIIMDYNQAENFTVDTVRKIKEKSPQTGILVISADNRKNSIYQVLELGVTCFLTKTCKDHEIMEGLEAVSKNQRFFCRKVMDYVFERSFSKNSEEEPLPLTLREIEIVKLAAKGLIAKEIADQLNITIHTVYTHRKNIMRKLKINTSSELVLYAVNNGLVNNN